MKQTQPLRCWSGFLGLIVAWFPQAPSAQSEAQKEITYNGPHIETLSGKPAALTDFRGKVVFLLISAKGPSNAAAHLLQEVYIGSGARSDIVYMTDADLKAAPGVLRGMLRSQVKGTAKKNHDRLIAGLQEAGIPFDPQREPVTLLDWQGALTQLFHVSGKTDRAYQAFVLSREGKMLFHYEQSTVEEKGFSPAPPLVKALQDAVSTKPDLP